MPLRLTIEKLYKGEYWTNVYHLDGAVADQTANADAIVAAERAITHNAVLFTKMRLDDNVPNTDNYATRVINQFGGVEGAAEATLLSLFNVLRVDFTVTGGRPSRKYLRGVLREDMVEFDRIIPASVSFFQTNYANVVANVAAYQQADAQDVTGAVVHPFVAMRQVRRGSKKKSTQSSPTAP